MIKRTEIKVETEETVIIRATSRAVSAWCPKCPGQTRMIALEYAAALAGTSLRSILRSVEAGDLHFTETDHGARLLICTDSLLESTKG